MLKLNIFSKQEWPFFCVFFNVFLRKKIRLLLPWMSCSTCFHSDRSICYLKKKCFREIYRHFFQMKKKTFIWKRILHVHGKDIRCRFPLRDIALATNGWSDVSNALVAIWLRVTLPCLWPIQGLCRVCTRWTSVLITSSARVTN